MYCLLMLFITVYFEDDTHSFLPTDHDESEIKILLPILVNYIQQKKLVAAEIIAH